MKRSRRGRWNEEYSLNHHQKIKFSQPLKMGSVRLNFDSRNNRHIFDKFVNNFLQKWNLQPIETHTHESYKAVIESLEKFNKNHGSLKKKDPLFHISRLFLK